jgi:RNA polymerase sigma-70 factor (ECF subfamily)
LNSFKAKKVFKGMTQEEKFKAKTGKDFNEFYKKYRPKLVWFLMKLSNDEEEAGEVADEAFVKSLDELDKYDREKAEYSTWLFIIAKRIMFHRIKEKKRFESIDQEHEGATIADFLISNDNNDSRQKEEILRRKVEIVKLRIKELPIKYSRVITMRELDGMSYQDIADYLNLNLSTVKSQIRQGRKLLIKKIQKEFDHLDNIGV